MGFRINPGRVKRGKLSNVCVSNLSLCLAVTYEL